MVIIGIVVLSVISFVVCGCLIHPNEYAKEKEDMEQIKYLREWNRKRSCK